MKQKVVVISIMLFIGALMVVLNTPPVFTAGRFTDNGDGTVTDNELGLMWAKADNQRDVGWQEASWYCHMGPPDIVGKYKGWRMPTVDELKSLYVMDPNYRGYKAACGQRVSITPEIRLSCGQVWCNERGLTTASAFSFADGMKSSEEKSTAVGFRALPVRSLSAD
ncbi:DUF1566 domain-containing protein [Desulfoferrobacter suflitae]|uniref:DUF1566 domain-containing protein n=1 Tax=Desulfoferrobacter suflitae TaxID=2865782 RepID=UPI00216478F3|nr:DUF1566 domain-containing protein [Desulfoferrobacter suflitae]MCK8602468.1 DUF1566 domain-containing protein [Desulfoferrobacter suflitae]